MGPHSRLLRPYGLSLGTLNLLEVLNGAGEALPPSVLAERMKVTRGTITKLVESAWLIAGLVRFVRDVDLAEELAQDALVAALEQWPKSGVPDRPGAWLMAVAKHRAIDLFRRNERLRRKVEELGQEIEQRDEMGIPDLDAIDDDIGDPLLRLVFIACHPVLSRAARVALTLRLLGGLTTEEIARAFLVPVPTIAQRIVRAKRTLARARVPFEVPGQDERPVRLALVLEVIYLIFNEGYAATAGDDWVRPALCEEALRLGRILTELVPQEPEVHGLVALQRAVELGTPLGPYALRAAIASCHAGARTSEETDWERIVALYDALAELAPSPIVDLNRAVAVGMAFGPAAALELVDELTTEPLLRTYHLLPSVRGEMLRSSRADGTAVRGAPPRREEVVRPQRTMKGKGSIHSLLLSIYSRPGTCGKTRVVPQNDWPRPETTEMGVMKCVCCCRRMGCEGTSNRWWDSRCRCGHSARPRWSTRRSTRSQRRLRDVRRWWRKECGYDRPCGSDRRRWSNRADVGGRVGVGGSRRCHCRTTRQSRSRRIARRRSARTHHRGA